MKICSLSYLVSHEYCYEYSSLIFTAACRQVAATSVSHLSSFHPVAVSLSYLAGWDNCNLAQDRHRCDSSQNDKMRFQGKLVAAGCVISSQQQLLIIEVVTYFLNVFFMSASVAFRMQLFAAVSVIVVTLSCLSAVYQS